MYIVGHFGPFVDRTSCPETYLSMRTRTCLATGLLLLSLHVTLAQEEEVVAVVPESSWMGALEATELTEVLENNGPFTVFAPAPQVFEQFLASRRGSLPDPEFKRELRALVSYHIVAGRITAARILKALCRGNGVARFTTIQGEELLASMDGTDIVLTDCSGNQARIVQADHTRQNLVYHHIDTVIMPTPAP